MSQLRLHGRYDASAARVGGVAAKEGQPPRGNMTRLHKQIPSGAQAHSRDVLRWALGNHGTWDSHSGGSFSSTLLPHCFPHRAHHVTVTPWRGLFSPSPLRTTAGSEQSLCAMETAPRLSLEAVREPCGSLVRQGLEVGPGNLCHRARPHPSRGG